MSEVKNILIATVLSIGVMFAWQSFSKKDAPVEQKQETAVVATQQPKVLEGRAIEKIDKSMIIKVENDKIVGEFSRQGLSFHDLLLKKYKETLDDDAAEVELFNKKNFYYSDFLFLQDENSNVELPNKNTVWESDSDVLTPEKPINLTWSNGAGVKFGVKISIDNDYLFRIDRSVFNATGEAISMNFASRISKDIDENVSGGIAHEGVVGFFNKESLQIPYRKLLKKDFAFRSKDKNEKLSWIGFGDKYWLSSLIMNEKNVHVSVKSNSDDMGAFTQITSTFGGIIQPNEEFLRTEYLFAGAKELGLLDKYESEKKILMFDHAVDFGVLYFITKPIFMLLQFFYKILGNFGVAIMILTLVIKFILFPLTKKSVISMNRMKKLQPKIDEIKTKWKDDKSRMNLEIVSLFRAEKISPFSSILPMLLQIPVFFALYKVLHITIEMRHAPFFGWIRDLSVRDSFNIFSVFDKLHINLSHYFNLGFLSLILCATMFLQQKLQPKPTADNNQMAMMKWMPVIFMFISGSFPSGLLIYWSWNNIVSVAQQIFIEKVIIKN